MVLPIVKKDENEFAQWLSTEWGFLLSLCVFEDERLKIEAYQESFLRNRSRWRWITKSRQVGYSFNFALEALARCHLRSNYTSVIVSYNQDDSKEKILSRSEFTTGYRLLIKKR